MKKNIKKITKLLSVALCAVIVSGCATVKHIPLSTENRKEIKMISVNPNMTKPDRMYDFAVGMEFGLIGYFAAGGESAGKDVQAYAEKNHVEIKSIIYQQWIKQIQNKNQFKLGTHDADADLSTDITMYGISIPHGFSNNYIPVLSINAKLVRNGKIVWQDSESVLPLTRGLPHYRYNELTKSPDALMHMWNVAAEKAVHEMLVDISKNSH